MDYFSSTTGGHCVADWADVWYSFTFYITLQKLNCWNISITWIIYSIGELFVGIDPRTCITKFQYVTEYKSSSMFLANCGNNNARRR
jgi:hypothetical protein